MGVINHILLHFYDVSVAAAAATRCAIGEKNHQKSFFFSTLCHRLFFFLLNTFESRLVSKMGISVHLGKGQALKDLMCALVRRRRCCYCAAVSEDLSG